MPEIRFGGLRAKSFWPARDVPEFERDKPTPRRWITYCCPKGHTFEVPFSDAVDVDVTIPDEWECRQHSVTAVHADARPESKPAKPPRTHWVMLLERRTIPELDALLAERLALLAAGREPAASGTAMPGSAATARRR